MAAKVDLGLLPSPDPLTALSDSLESGGPGGEQMNRRSLLCPLDLPSPREDAGRPSSSGEVIG